MDGIKRNLTLIMLIGTLAVPVHAKTSDTAVFSAWLAQRAGNGREFALERLPCLRGDKGACDSPLLSALSERGRGAVDPFKGSAKPSRPKRLKADFKRVKRVKAGSGQSGLTSGHQMRAFASAGRTLVLHDSANRLFDIDFDAPSEPPTGELEMLSALVSEVTPATPRQDPLLDAAAGGLGDSAFVALYNFDDEAGGAGESGVQEISSLVSAQSLLVSALTVPEPGTLVLVGAGLLALSLRWRRSQAEQGANPSLA